MPVIGLLNNNQFNMKNIKIIWTCIKYGGAKLYQKFQFYKDIRKFS